jgi:hypothetical protein
MRPTSQHIPHVYEAPAAVTRTSGGRGFALEGRQVPWALKRAKGRTAKEGSQARFNMAREVTGQNPNKSSSTGNLQLRCRHLTTRSSGRAP